MQDNKRYLIVGSFVLIGISLIIGTLLWFTATNRKAYDTYKIIFHEPIDGITTNSVVKYNGVEVGRVKGLSLNRQNPNDIIVFINVTQGLPIYTSTTSTIKPQGVTGMSYIALNLNKSSNKLQIITPNAKEPYSEIRSEPSLFYSLSEQAQSVTGNIRDISTQVRSMLSDKTINHIDHIVSNVDKLTTALSDRSGEMVNIVLLVSQVLSNVNNNTHNLNQAIAQLGVLTKSLQQNSNNLDKVLTTLQGSTLQSVNAILLPNINQAVIHLNQTSNQLEQLMKTLNQNPSILLRGRQDAQPGPGE